LVDIARLSIIVSALLYPDVNAKCRILTLLVFAVVGFTALMVYLNSEIQGFYMKYPTISELDKALYYLLWYGMHSTVILSYTSIYILIRRYYQGLRCRHGMNMSEQDLAKTRSDLFALLVLFLCFCFYAVVLIPTTVWVFPRDLMAGLIIDAVASLIQMAGICFSFGKRILLDTSDVRDVTQNNVSLFILDSEHLSTLGRYEASKFEPRISIN